MIRVSGTYATTCSGSVREALRPPASVTSNVGLLVPGVVAVPVICPAAEMDSPGGSPTAVQTNGAVAPAAARLAAYGWPTEAGDSAVVVMLMAPRMVSPNVAESAP